MIICALKGTEWVIRVKKIFWGLLFLLINININQISITPSFIGYILICLGMKEYEEVTAFNKTRPWVIVGGVWSAVFWLPIINIGYLNVIGLILELYVTYQIMRGMGELEQTRGLDLRSEKLRTAWCVEAVCNVLTWLLGLMQAGLAFVTMIVGVVAAIVYIVAFYRSQKALEE